MSLAGVAVCSCQVLIQRSAAQVAFVPSFTDRQRTELLQACQAVVYTPANEHFGIVPLEGMAAGRPVIASNSGGPLETVVHEATGLLCEPQPADFAQAMNALAVRVKCSMPHQACPNLVCLGCIPGCAYNPGIVVQYLKVRTKHRWQ